MTTAGSNASAVVVIDVRAVRRCAGETAARSVVVVRQIAGMLYLAVAVSRVVGLTINRRRAAQEDR